MMLGRRSARRAASTTSTACALRAAFPTFRWWSMPGWACPSTPRRPPWSWATTPCCSTRRWPKPAIRSRWRAPSRSPSRRAASFRPAARAARHGQPSTPVVGRAVLRLNMLDRFYPHRADAVGGARLVRRHAPDPASHQGPAGRRSVASSGSAGSACAAAGAPAHRQRLLAGGDRRRVRLRPSRPGGSGRRRHRGAAPGGRPASSASARTITPSWPARHRSRLRGARPDLSDPAQSKMPWAPQVGTDAWAGMEAPDRQAGRWWRSAASPRTRATLPGGRRRHRAAVVGDIVNHADPLGQARAWIAATRAAGHDRPLRPPDGSRRCRPRWQRRGGGRRWFSGAVGCCRCCSISPAPASGA